jgi:hypothetical protein
MLCADESEKYFEGHVSRHKAKLQDGDCRGERADFIWRRMKLPCLLAFLVLCQTILAEVTVLKVVQTIYDRSPKLRIRGSGFDADEHSIILELSASGQSSLKADKDYLITKDDDGVILKLLSARR